MSPSGSELLWWDSVAAARMFEQFAAHTPATRVKAARLGDLAVRVTEEYEGWAALEGAAAATRDEARRHVLLGFYAARAVSTLDPSGSSLKTFLAGFEAGFSTWFGNNWQLWSEGPVNIFGRGRGRKIGTRSLIENSEQFMYAWMEPAMPACAPQGYGGTLSQQAPESRVARTLETWSRESGHATGSNEVRALLARGCSVFRAACELTSDVDLQPVFVATIDDLVERIEGAEPIGAIGRPVDPASGYVPFLGAEKLAEIADQRSSAAVRQSSVTLPDPADAASADADSSPGPLSSPPEGGYVASSDADADELARALSAIDAEHAPRLVREMYRANRLAALLDGFTSLDLHLAVVLPAAASAAVRRHPSHEPQGDRRADPALAGLELLVRGARSLATPDGARTLIDRCVAAGRREAVRHEDPLEFAQWLTFKQLLAIAAGTGDSLPDPRAAAAPIHAALVEAVIRAGDEPLLGAG